MKPHTKIYFNYFNFKIPEDCFCEICGSPAVDLHHIESRGSGGSKTKDYIENLMAVCRECHIAVGDVPDKKEWLKDVHRKFMSKNKR
jgi:5-methylcytosine-specific restriction endonuclease McrA